VELARRASGSEAVESARLQGGDFLHGARDRARDRAGLILELAQVVRLERARLARRGALAAFDHVAERLQLVEDFLLVQVGNGSARECRRGGRERTHLFDPKDLALHRHGASRRIDLNGACSGAALNARFMGPLAFQNYQVLTMPIWRLLTGNYKRMNKPFLA